MLQINFHEIYKRCSIKILKRNSKIIKKLFIILVLFSISIAINSYSQDIETIEDSKSTDQDDLLLYVEDFINLPQGGTSWKIFGETGMEEYPVTDKEGFEWTGVRPKFRDAIKKLNSKEILVQGYMFPLEESEKQSLFLLGPFPLSCPYHPHVSSNLLIEVHANKPVLFSYDPVNIKGKLELVAKDDDYNIFFRLNDAKLVSN